MKRLLSLLMCYVFLQAETFALRGGPGGGSKLAGSYSGVLTEATGGSSLGLFLISMQNVGASNGSIIFFEQSTTGARFYSGTMTGLINPISGGFTGLFNSTAQVASTFGTVSVTISLALSGTITLAITGAATRSSNQQIGGDAVAQANSGTLKKFTVSGWQTSGDAVSGGFTAIDNKGG